MSAHFHPLKVADIVPETADANSILFDVPAELRGDFAFRAGQHLTLKAQINGADVRRNYSLCTAPDSGEWKVTVKQIAGGLFSNWVASSLKVGDVLEVMPPHGSFTTRFEPHSRRHFVGIAGGSGITPVMSLLKTALKTEKDSRFTLFYGNRDSASIIFLDELASLKDRYLDRLELYHFLAEEEGDFDLFNGLLDRERVAEAIRCLIADPKAVDGWFICGPGPMMDGAEAQLLETGIDKDKIHIERFTADRPSAALAREMATLKSRAAGKQISITLDGRTRRVAFDEENILDSARSAGLPAPFACKAGVCATCRARLTSGKVEMASRYGLTDEEIEAGYILTCQSVPATDDVAVDYDS